MVNWIVQTSRPIGRRRFVLSRRFIENLRPHEKPAYWRVWLISRAMRAGKGFPLISIAEDGMILDGHARYYALLRVIKQRHSIPVGVSIP